MAQVATQVKSVDAQKLLQAKLADAKPDYVLRHTNQPSTAQA